MVKRTLLTLILLASAGWRTSAAGGSANRRTGDELAGWRFSQLADQGVDYPGNQQVDRWMFRQWVRQLADRWVPQLADQGADQGAGGFLQPVYQELAGSAGGRTSTTRGQTRGWTSRWAGGFLQPVYQELAGSAGGRTSTTRGQTRGWTSRWAGGPDRGSWDPVWQSLLLPGKGQAALQRPLRSRLFYLTETALWSAVLGSFLAARSEALKYRAYAARHAEVDPAGKEHDFWVDIGNYLSREDYNQEHLRFREIRALYPTTSQWDWNWDSDPHRQRFESWRKNSDRWVQWSLFFLGGVVVNHLVAAIDARYLQKVSLQPVLDPASGGAGVSLSLNVNLNLNRDL